MAPSGSDPGLNHACAIGKAGLHRAGRLPPCSSPIGGRRARRLSPGFRGAMCGGNELEVDVMTQRGQVLSLKSIGGGAESWAYRYRTGGRDSKRVQRGGIASRVAAEQALDRALQRLRQEHGLIETPILSEFVELYLSQHDGRAIVDAPTRAPAVPAACEDQFIPLPFNTHAAGAENGCSAGAGGQGGSDAVSEATGPAFSVPAILLSRTFSSPAL